MKNLRNFLLLLCGICVLLTLALSVADYLRHINELRTPWQKLIDNIWTICAVIAGFVFYFLALITEE